MKKFFYITNIIAGILLALTPFVLFPVCSEFKPDGTRMGCWYSGIFITIMGAVILAFALLAFFEKSRGLFMIPSSVCALICWLVPNKIIDVPLCSLCANPEHSCRASTIYAVGIITALLIIINAIFIIILFVKGEK